MLFIIDVIFLFSLIRQVSGNLPFFFSRLGATFLALAWSCFFGSGLGIFLTQVGMDSENGGGCMACHMLSLETKVLPFGTRVVAQRARKYHSARAIAHSTPSECFFHEPLEHLCGPACRKTSCDPTPLWMGRGKAELAHRRRGWAHGRRRLTGRGSPTGQRATPTTGHATIWWRLPTHWCS